MAKKRYGKFLFALILLILILAIGTFGYPLIEPNIDIFDAFYMTVITITTVGFGELQGISPASRPLTIFLIFFGFGLISFMLFAISQIVVEGEVRRFFGRQKLDKKIATLSNHIIICGFGRVGEVIAHYLGTYHVPFVIVEMDEERRELLENKAYLYVIGDATQDEILLKAGVKKASKLVAVTNSDSQNVFITLTARELNPSLVIHSRAYVEEAEKRLIRAGANRVIFPDNIGGFRMAMGLLRPSFSTFVDFITRPYEEGDIAVDELFVGAKCSLVNRSLVDARIRQNFNIIVIAIRKKDGRFHFNPGKDSIILEGDTLLAIGMRRDLVAFSEEVKIEELQYE